MSRPAEPTARRSIHDRAYTAGDPDRLRLPSRISARQPGPRQTFIHPPRWFSLFYQRVAGFEFREPREIAVGGPEFAHAMVQAEGGNAGVMNARAGQFGGQRQFAQCFIITGAFGEEMQLRRAKQLFQKTQGFGQRGGRLVNAGMG